MDKRLLFLLLVGTVLLFGFLNSYVLINEGLYFNNFAEQLSYEQIEDMLAQGKKWEWLGYAIIPVIYLIKLSLVAACLSVGVFFVSNQFEFKRLWGVALVAEFVFVVPIIVKILWFAFVQTDYSLKDLQFFYPLSALNFFDYKHLESWWVYPLQTLNVFEVLYWVVLAWQMQASPQTRAAYRPEGGFSTAKEITIGASFQLVLMSYGVGLLLWVAAVMFISVSYSA
jgi:hypothetical protein